MGDREIPLGIGRLIREDRPTLDPTLQEISERIRTRNDTVLGVKFVDDKSFRDFIQDYKKAFEAFGEQYNTIKSKFGGNFYERSETEIEEETSTLLASLKEILLSDYILFVDGKELSNEQKQAIDKIREPFKDFINYYYSRG